MYPIHPSLSGRTQVQGQHSHFNRELKLMSAHDREGGEFKVEPGDWSQRVLLSLWFLSQTWLLLFPSDVEAVSCASNVTYGRQCRWIHQTVSRLNTFGSDCNISTIIKCIAVKILIRIFLVFIVLLVSRTVLPLVSSSSLLASPQVFLLLLISSLLSP